MLICSLFKFVVFFVQIFPFCERSVFGENVMEWVIVSFMYDNYWELLFFFAKNFMDKTTTKNKYQNIHKLTMTMKKNCTPAFSLYFIGVVNKYIHALSISFSFSLFLLLLSLSLFILYIIYISRVVYVYVGVFWHLKGEGPENWTGVKGGKIHCEAYTHKYSDTHSHHAGRDEMQINGKIKIFFQLVLLLFSSFSFSILVFFLLLL